MLLAVSDAVWNGLIAALLAIALKWMDYRSQQRAKVIKEDLEKAKTESKEELAVVAGNVQKIETATNSMKDALVEATRKAATLQGRADERSDPSPVAVQASAIVDNVETLKDDVKEVKRDVKAVKAEVIQETKKPPR